VKRSLRTCLDVLASAYRRGARLALLFDYDGTLVPITAHPRQARLPPARRSLLRRLARRPRVAIGIFSGRSLPDLKRTVSLPGLYFAGLGGLESELAGKVVRHPGAARARRLIAFVLRRLDNGLRGCRGAVLEDKRLGLTVHYRHVQPEQIGGLLAFVRQTLAPYARRLRCVQGPMALEIAPRLGWTKATALRRVLRHAGVDGTHALYAGDFDNDAEALAAIAAMGGIGIGIGPRAPRDAAHRLPDDVALFDWLSRLDGLLGSSRASRAFGQGK